MTEDGDIIVGPRLASVALPVLVGADDDGHCVARSRALPITSWAIDDEYELGPAGDRAAYTRCH